MKMRPTTIDGLWLIALETTADERGTFTRVFDRDTFESHGLCTEYPQHGVATNVRRGVVRGLHYQTAPFAEHKVVRCARGRVWDVVVDLRRSSPTYGTWEAFTLDAARPELLYLTAGLAHGYQVLSAGAELHYLLSARYAVDHAAGVHWRDRSLAIPWPLSDVVISARDDSLPALSEAPDSAP